jgi:adenine-specific DNA-methyltransferase
MEQFELFDEDDQNLYLKRFPTTRYQGSKRKMLLTLANSFSEFNFNTALDLYSGSGTVSLLLRHLKKNVIANDYLKYNQNTAEVFLTAKTEDFNKENFIHTLEYLLKEAPIKNTPLVNENFKDIYYTEEENLQIDRFCQNLNNVSLSPLLQKIAIYCVGQSLLMKRPYNLFHRANLNMRTKNVKRSFGNAKTWETSISKHSIKIFTELSKFPFAESTGLTPKTLNLNTLELTKFPTNIDLIYLDPPYMNKKGTGVDYGNFYHFLDGLIDYRLFANGNNKFAHKPIIRKQPAWSNKNSALQELKQVASYWKDAILVISYRNDGIPNQNEIALALRECGRTSYLSEEISYKYALSKGTNTKEQLIISDPTRA